MTTPRRLGKRSAWCLALLIAFSSATGCAGKLDSSSVAAPVSPAAPEVRPPAAPVSAPAGSPRKDVEAFVAEIIVAAKERDFPTLDSLLELEFTIAEIEARGVDAAPSGWRENPEYLDQVVQLLEGPCAFVNGDNHFVCPRSVATLGGEATSVHLYRRSGSWSWGAFIAGAPSEPEVGSQTKEVIRGVVRSHIGEVRRCYNKLLVEDPELTGRVAIEFTITPSGSVARVAIAESTVPKPLAGCIAKAAESWIFPKPGLGGNVVVHYPFVLEPG